MTSMIKGLMPGLGKPTNTYTSAVDVVFYLSSLSLKVEFSLKLGAAKQQCSNQLELRLLNPPSSPVKGDANPNNGFIVEASGSTKDTDRDFAMGVSEDDTDQGVNESDSDSDSWESTANSSPESATGDNYLLCLDTEEAIMKSTHKRFYKKVHASCSPTKQGLWRDAHLEQISSSHQAMLGNNYETIRTEWDRTLDKDHSSFKEHRMTVSTEQLLHIEEATNVKNSYPHEHEAKVYGRRRHWCSH